MLPQSCAAINSASLDSKWAFCSEEVHLHLSLWESMRGAKKKNKEAHHVLVRVIVRHDPRVMVTIQFASVTDFPMTVSHLLLS